MKALLSLGAVLSFLMIFCIPETFGIGWLLPVSGIALFALCAKLYDKYCMTKEEKEEEV